MKKIFLLIAVSFGLVLSGCGLIRSVPTNVGTGTVQPVITGQQATGTQTTTGTQTSTIPSRAYVLQLGGNTPKLSFSLNVGDKIRLLIAQPPVKAVVRVNQIITPDGQADGPFSSDTEYTATQSGTHNFTIGVNQMASEDIYTGSVTVHVTLDLKK